MFCFTKNPISKKYEWKLGSKALEKHIIAPIISTKIQKTFDGKIFKQDTPEVKLVKDIINKVVIANNLDEYIDTEQLMIKVVYNHNLIMFFNWNHHFYITHKCINLTHNDERQLALLICHELSHYLLDHQARRVAIIVYATKIFNKWFETDEEREIKLYDPVHMELKERNQY
jgi:hypothetical protein